MSRDGTWNRDATADGVRKRPDIFRSDATSRKDRYLGKYTDRWKDTCREIIRVYAKLSPIARPSRPLGATLLLRQIIAHSGLAASAVTLSADNLYDWLKGASGHLDDLKFSYVDDFVRGLQLDAAGYEPVRERLAKEHDSTVRLGLKQMYGHRSLTTSAQEFSSVFADNYAFMSTPFRTDWRSDTVGLSFGYDYLLFSQVAVYLHSYEDGVYAVNAIYSKRPFWQLRNSGKLEASETVAYFGYVVQSFYGQAKSPLYGTMHLARQGLQGLDNLHANTVSVLLYATQIRPPTIYTSWFPQLMTPDRSYSGISGYKAPELNLRLENSNEGEDLSSRDGMLALGKIGEDYNFVIDYLSSLTNGYVIW